MEVGDPALLHRSGRQVGKFDDVADGVDMVHFRMKILVHGNQFTIADGQADFLKVQATRPPVRPMLCSALSAWICLPDAKRDTNPLAAFVAEPFQTADLFAEPQGHAVLPHLIDQRVDHFVILEGEQP